MAVGTSSCWMWQPEPELVGIREHEGHPCTYTHAAPDTWQWHDDGARRELLLLGATYPEIKVASNLCILWFGVRAASGKDPNDETGGRGGRN